MPRSTEADKARQLNAAHRLLERNVALPGAAQSLSRKFGLSLRQAYRYVKEAARLERPSGLTIGRIVTRALEVFWGALAACRT